MNPKPDPSLHTRIRDVMEWRDWLDEHESTHDGIWLVLAKKGVVEPTSLSYEQAVHEALCSGWIDGQGHTLDEATYLVRFTPRRKASVWSTRNVGIVADLIEQGRMRERGHAEIERAKADGRWDRAYEGEVRTAVTADFTRALESSRSASSAFAQRSRAQQYSLLQPVISAPATSREARIAALIEMLEAESRLLSE